MLRAGQHIFFQSFFVLDPDLPRLYLWAITVTQPNDCPGEQDGEAATCHAGLTAVRIHSFTHECNGGMYKCCGAQNSKPTFEYPLGTSTRLTSGPGSWWIYDILGWVTWMCAAFYALATGARYGLDGCGHYRGYARFFAITGGFDGALESTATRLVLRGSSAGCACLPGRCGGLGLRPEYKQAVPRELLVRGVTEEVWREWMEKLDSVEKKAKSFDCCRLATTSYQPW